MKSLSQTVFSIDLVTVQSYDNLVNRSKVVNKLYNVLIKRTKMKKLKNPFESLKKPSLDQLTKIAKKFDQVKKTTLNQLKFNLTTTSQNSE